MHTAHSRNVIGMIGMFGLLAVLPACQQLPTAPTGSSIEPPAAGIVSSTSSAPETLDDDVPADRLLRSGAIGASVGSSVSCQPTFTRTPTNDATFFLLTIDAPAGCQWFAKEVEEGGSYWDLTVPDYSQRNRKKYPYGVFGVGRADLGVHFSAKIGYRNHLTFVLDVCPGDACTATSQRWTYTYTIQMP